MFLDVALVDLAGTAARRRSWRNAAIAPARSPGRSDPTIRARSRPRASRSCRAGAGRAGVFDVDSASVARRLEAVSDIITTAIKPHNLGPAQAASIADQRDRTGSAPAECEILRYSVSSLT